MSTFYERVEFSEGIFWDGGGGWTFLWVAGDGWGGWRYVLGGWR